MQGFPATLFAAGTLAEVKAAYFLEGFRPGLGLARLRQRIDLIGHHQQFGVAILDPIQDQAETLNTLPPERSGPKNGGNRRLHTLPQSPPNFGKDHIITVSCYP